MQPFRPWFDQVWLGCKIARNPLKVCMHGYLSNGYLNFLSKLNYEKVRKISSLRPLLNQRWIRNKIAPNIVKVSLYSYLPNAQINLRSNFNSEKLVKCETSLCGFDKVRLKGGENISERRENSLARLFIQSESKSMIKFQFWEVGQSENPSCGFVRVWLKGAEDSSKHCESWRVLLSIKSASKSMIKFQFREIGQQWTSVMNFR